MFNGDIVKHEFVTRVTSDVNHVPVVLFQAACKIDGIEEKGLCMMATSLTVRPSEDKGLVVFNNGIAIPGVQSIRVHNVKDELVYVTVKALCKLD